MFNKFDAFDLMGTDDKELALEAVEFDSYNYVYLKPELQEDKDIKEKVLAKYLEDLDDMNKSFQDFAEEGEIDEKFGIEYFDSMNELGLELSKHTSGWEFDLISTIKYRKQAMSLMRMASEQYGALSQGLRNDEEIFWEAYENTVDTSAAELYEYAGKELRNNPEFKVRVTEVDPYWIFDNPEFMEDKQMVITALKNFRKGDVLDFLEEASEMEFDFDREVFVVALSINPEALEYASEELQQDETIMAEAIALQAKRLEELKAKREQSKALIYSYQEKMEKYTKMQEDK